MRGQNHHPNELATFGSRSDHDQEGNMEHTNELSGPVCDNIQERKPGHARSEDSLEQFVRTPEDFPEQLDTVRDEQPKKEPLTELDADDEPNDGPDAMPAEKKDLCLSVGSDHLDVAPINSELQHLDAVVAVEALHEQRGQSVFKQVLNQFASKFSLLIRKPRREKKLS